MMTRRLFCLRFLPALAAAPLAQWPYSQPETPRLADTPENLTWRVTVLEFAQAGLRAVVTEQGKSLEWMGKQLGNPGHYGPDEPREI